MVRKKIALAADHAGFALKSLVRDELAGQGYETLDLGTGSEESVDYPDFGRALGEAVAAGKADCGVLVCGTGIGISIAANRVAGVRAAVCHDVTTARLARLHNDANVLALGSRIVGLEVARDCVQTFLNTEFEGGRHGRRVGKLG
jgi:ribose 5-phosphate isomerase B